MCIVFVFAAKSLFMNFYLGTIHNRHRLIFPIFRPTAIPGFLSHFWIPIPSASIMDDPFHKKNIILFMTFKWMWKPSKKIFVMFDIIYAGWNEIQAYFTDSPLAYIQSRRIFHQCICITNIHWFCQSVQKNSFDNAEQMLLPN